MEKEVTTKATCEYSTELWQAGGTCIIDVLVKQNEASPKYACPKTVEPALIEDIKSKCTANTAEQGLLGEQQDKEAVDTLCSPIALSF